MQEIVELKNEIIESCIKNMDSLDNMEKIDLFNDTNTNEKKRELLDLMSDKYLEYEKNFEKMQDLLEKIMDNNFNVEDTNFQEMIEEYVAVITQSTEIIKTYLESIEKILEKILNQEINTQKSIISLDEDNRIKINNTNLLLNSIRVNKLNQIHENYYKSLKNAYKSYKKFLTEKMDGLADGTIGGLSNTPDNLYM